jgi:ubiquinone/menaquinone biosynthesis C-methylase UbiE
MDDEAMTNAAWGDVAELWLKDAEARNRLMAEMTARMLDDAAVVPGMRVLEVGAGTGDVALVLSERVGRYGRVVATDGSTAMLDSAAEAIRTSGASNVTLKVGDASARDFDDASFDAVVARMVLMFVDLDVVLPGVRRVMRVGARFGAAVWGPVANNPFHRIVIEAARAEGGWGDAQLEVVQAHSRGDAAMYQRALAKAGFVEVRTHVVRGRRTFVSLAEALAKIRESPIHTAPIANAKEGRRASAWDRVERELREFERSGAIELPVEWLVLSGGR